MPDPAPRSTVLVWFENHFDLVWRRCWRRAYEHEGLVYRSYADVHDAWLQACLRLAERDGAAFQVEQAITVREFLRRHPERLDELRRLAREGRFLARGAGEAIIDANLCLGETLVRNLASGLRYVRETLGCEPIAACHNDGFGSSAQLPQVVRGCGLRGIDGLSYSRPDAPYWRGIDGSTVFCAFDRPGLNFFTDHCYYEPCLACRGIGDACARCAGTGLRLAQGVHPERPWLADPVPALARYTVSGEELMPDPRLAVQIAARNACDPTVAYRWGTERELLPLWADALAGVDDPGVAVSSRIENNPAQTGCYVTRLASKQSARRAEGAVYAAERLAVVAGLGGEAVRRLEEAWLALPILHFHDAVTGTHNDPAAAELLALAADACAAAESVAIEALAALIPGARAVTAVAAGQHVAVFNPHAVVADLDVELPATNGAVRVVDAAGREQPVHRQPCDEDPPAQDALESIASCRAYRVPGSPEASAPNFECVGPAWHRKRGEEPPRSLRFRAGAVPPLGVAVFRLDAAAPPVATSPAGEASLDDVVLRWDERGVTGIRCGGDELIDGSRGRAGHLILEEDEGDPWSTRSPRRGRRSCEGMQRLLRARATRDAVELCYAGALENGGFGDELDPRVFGLHWRQTVRALRGMPGVEVELEIFWRAVDRRIRVAFPTFSRSDAALYGIPAASLDRPRYDAAGHGLFSPGGDWPAVGFVATEPPPGGAGLALIERGTPSLRVEDGVLLCSLLRSPGSPHAMTRFAQEYPMPLSGMADGGRHVARWTLLPHRPCEIAAVVDRALRAQLPTYAVAVGADARGIASGWAIADEGVELAALKPAWDGDGSVFRLVERLGRARALRVRVPDGVAELGGADHLEQPDGERFAVVGGEAVVPLRAWGIRTLRARRAVTT